MYDGPSAWFFVTIPRDVSADIKEESSRVKVAWGSVPVVASVGETVWNTSLFPDKKSGGYLLPLRADIRKKEGIVAGDKVVFTLEV